MCAQYKEFMNDDDYESDGEMDNNLKISKFVIEAYDPETLDFVREVTLDFGKNDDEWGYHAQDYFKKAVTNFNNFSFATNGIQIVLNFEGCIFFDIKTGQMQYFKKPWDELGTLYYEHMSNHFWNFKQDECMFDVKRGILTNFEASEALKSGDLNSIGDYQKDRFKVVKSK